MSRDFRVGEWFVQPDLNQISKGDQIVAVEPKVLEVLVYLAQHPGEVLSRENILQGVWTGTFVTDEVLTYSISELRKALEDDAKNPRIIQTIHRKGYRLIAPVVLPGGEPAQAPAPLEKSEPQRAAAPPGGKRLNLGIGLGVLIVALAVAALMYFARVRLQAPSGAPGSKIVLAVLPFENLAGDPEQDYFSDGMTEELITQIGRLQPQSLRVIARTSAMQYKNTHKKVDQIGAELGVSYILEGSTRREENRVRVTAQLIRVQDQTQIWAENYDRELSGIITVQNEVAKAVASQIRITLSDAERVRLENPRPVVPEAHEAYLRGRFVSYKRTPQNLRRAIDYFEEAIKRGPSYAAPHTGLADAYILLNEYSDMSPKEAFAKAGQAASKALEIDPGLAETHASLAMIRYCAEWDWAGAENGFQHSIDLNPNYATAHHWYGNLLSTLGRLDEAQVEMQKAVQLDSLYTTARIALAWRVYGAMRKYDLAIQTAQAAIGVDPQYASAHLRLGMLYLLTGRSEEAVKEIEGVVSDSDAGPFALADQGYIYAVTGRRADAQKILDKLQGISRGGYVDNVRLAVVYVGLGDKSRALDLLEKALVQRDVGMLVVKPDPRFDPLRDEPRFKAILRAMKLAE
jgi:TolB-like protein/DNA-binding winged helix-turn-helix (wHTH) protein/Tfp pilus assembly protein PilF